MSSYQIEWNWKEFIEQKYIALAVSRERILLLPNDSTTIDFVIKKILYHCLSESRFVFLLSGCDVKGRYELMCSVIGDLKMEFLFETDDRAKDIWCINGNRILGIEDEKRLRKIKFPCGAWYERPSIRTIQGVSGLIKQEGEGYKQEIITCPLNSSGDFDGLQTYLNEKHGHSFKTYSY